MAMQILQGKPHTKTMSSLWENVCSMQQDRSLQQGVQEKRNHAVHEVEIDMEPESQEEDTEIVSINSVYINRKWSSITAKLHFAGRKSGIRNPI